MPKTHMNFSFSYVFAYVPNMQITLDVYGKGAGTNTNSVHTDLSRDLLWVSMEQRESQNLLRFGLEIVNPLQEASVWTLAVSRSFTSRLISIPDTHKDIHV